MVKEYPKKSMNPLTAIPVESSKWTVRSILDWTTGYLRRGKVEAARFETEELLAHALRVERLELYLTPDRLLNLTERARFRELVRQRHAGTPLAYLLGTVEFMNVKLRVNPSVLIPRVETEELVERIVRDFHLHPQARHLRLLDLGTGSGAIAIALAKEWPGARALAVDLSYEALTLAQENAKLNSVWEQVTFVCSDWFSAVQGQFDVIVSNPPYIPTEDLRTLPKEVAAHEPRQALDGGQGGLREIERIVREAPHFLPPGGRLYLEIGSSQAEDISRLFAEITTFSQVEVQRDLAGRDRIVRAIHREEP